MVSRWIFFFLRSCGFPATSDRWFGSFSSLASSVWLRLTDLWALPVWTPKFEPRQSQGHNCASSCLLFSCSVVSHSLQPHGLRHARPPCPSTSPGACSVSCPLSQQRHLTICRALLLPSGFPSISKFTVSMAKFDTWTTTGSKEIPCHLWPFGPNMSGESFIFSWTWPSQFILQKNITLKLLRNCAYSLLVMLL